MKADASFSALVDQDDRLLGADARFATINHHAGGVAETRLAVPRLLTLVQLARRLRVPIARMLTLAEDRVDIDWYVRAIPDGDRSVALAATLLRERRVGRAGAVATQADVPPPADAAWTWEVDGALCVTRIAPDVGIDPAAVLGGPLTAVFALEAGADGAMPLLEAMGKGADFHDQVATLRVDGRRVMLAGHVRHDAPCGFAGFVGGTFLSRADRRVATLADDFNARLERVLREPLGQIIAQAENINVAPSGTIDPHYAEYAADIASAGRHLLGLVDDLVDLEAIERADFATAREPIDLADVVRRAAGLLFAEAVAAQVVVVHDHGAAAMIACGEYRRALQIVVNLIGNAVRYSPAGGTVRVSVSRKGRCMLVVVADDGPGIPEDEHARIFEKFARVDSGGPAGNGLGLYIARRLAGAMDGTIEVDSRPNDGARFTLSLPVVDHLPQASRYQDQKQAPGRGPRTVVGP